MSGPEEKGDELLTVRDVAKLLAVSTATVYKIIASGELASHRVSAALLRVRRHELNAYVSRVGRGS